MKNRQSGFTLVELAIVLVIIGLLLGGVLKGQEMITQAKVRNVANDFAAIPAAVLSYQDRYRRLPGDDNGAKRWPAITTLPDTAGNSLVDGAYAAATDGAETRLFWQHLRLAGFIAGDSASQAQPLNATNGTTGVQQGGLSLTGLVLCSGSLPARIAAAVDAQLDDGNALTGAIRGLLEGATPPTAVPAAQPADAKDYVDNGTNLYVICKSV